MPSFNPTTPQPLSRQQFQAVLEGRTTVKQIAQKRAAYQRAVLQNEFEASYSLRSTKHLLNALRNLRANLFREAEWRQEDDPELIELRAAYHAVKKVLATRPNILSKTQQSTRRRLMARANRGQGKAKNR
jgi:hypothetical protein